ncbi:tubulin epsilon and delta complex protein 2 isoform X6 [Manis pentadactyla]|uniref:tubulin epsilon and delta complex protein 2 isoform X6 n=1 Tax=Manis pentadactyla TaxID=143292 RepID=UPI00255C2DD9|nr:tubulin epsilon and delta complex protein 2 isoform X6 [Manis pentadactyla]
MLPAGCSRRLVAELRGALDACDERQRQLERSLRVARRLLRAWEPEPTPAPEPTPGPETEEAPSPARTPSSEDLKELELLTQALEKAVQVRKGICKAGEKDKDPSLKSATLLQLPLAFRKAASQNSRLWAQLSCTQTSDSMNAVTTAKTQFLQKMQTTSGWPSSGLSAAEVEAEVGRLRTACWLLRLRMGEELAADPRDWMQEYRCLLTLEGLQAIAGQCLHRLQELRAAVMGQQLGPWPEETVSRASLPCGGGADPIWSPQLLLYSSTGELQALAALRLRVAMLDQQIHLEKVLMAELLPLVSTQEPLGPACLALCRAAHSLLCEGGQHFLTILQDGPAD